MIRIKVPTKKRVQNTVFVYVKKKSDRLHDWEFTFTALSEWAKGETSGERSRERKMHKHRSAADATAVKVLPYYTRFCT